eukprot:4897615-Prymnesium_polylepis.1
MCAFGAGGGSLTSPRARETARPRDDSLVGPRTFESPAELEMTSPPLFSIRTVSSASSGLWSTDTAVASHSPVASLRDARTQR